MFSHTMLGSFLSLINIVKCVEYSQQLVFGTEHGKDGSVNHFCDFQIKPQVDINSVTIFMKTGEGDQAVPKVTLRPTISPMSPGYLRVKIPPIIDRKGQLYNFQFECKGDLQLHSENWTYDPETNQFALASAVKKNFYKSKQFYIICACSGAVVLLAISGLVYKAFRKSKSSL